MMAMAWSATIRSTASDWNYSLPVSVSQVRSSAFAVPAITTVIFEGRESRQTVTVSSNVDDWTVSVSEAWLTVERAADGSGIVIDAIGSLFRL